MTFHKPVGLMADLCWLLIPSRTLETLKKKKAGWREEGEERSEKGREGRQEKNN